MRDEIETYYGNKNEFAIRYLNDNDNLEFAFCHLIFEDKLIGNINETCYLRTWKHSVEILKNEIMNGNFKIANDINFINKSDDEIFDLIWNENQDYRSHQITIDETIDPYLISLIETNNKLKFIWKNLSKSSNNGTQIGKLNVLEISTEKVINAIEITLNNI